MTKPSSSVPPATEAQPREPLGDIDALLDAFQRACEECIETPYPEKYEVLPKFDAARLALRAALAEKDKSVADQWRVINEQGRKLLTLQDALGAKDERYRRLDAESDQLRGEIVDAEDKARALQAALDEATRREGEVLDVVRSLRKYKIGPMGTWACDSIDGILDAARASRTTGPKET